MSSSSMEPDQVATSQLTGEHTSSRVRELVQVADDEGAKNTTSFLPFLQYIKPHT